MAGETTTPTDVRRVDGFGVPAFWLPHDGQASAGILVRSGRSIEPLALSGITHLISHLVANELGLPPHGAGAYTDLDVMGYSFSGEPEHVQAYLSAYGSLLSVPPVDDLALAIAECRHEATQAPYNVSNQLLRLRHGARGPGALSFDEYAFHKAGHKQIQHWASRYLHNNNMALWISGPKLDGLKLRVLNGVPIRVNAPLLAIPTPGSAYGNKGEVGFSMLAPRTQSFGALISIAERRAEQELVGRRGASTRITFDVGRHDTTHLELVVTADVVGDRDNEVLETLLWSFEQLAKIPPSQSEVDEFRNTIASLFHRDDLSDFRAREAAVHFLTGVRPYTWRSMFDELDELTPESVMSAAANALESILCVASRDCSILTERFTYVGNWIPSLAQGAHLVPIPRPNEKVDRELIVGKGGITTRAGDFISSVQFGECVLVLRRGTNFRELISENGSRVVVDGNDWVKGAYMIELIDRECPQDNMVVLDDADTEAGYVGAERRRWRR